MLILDEPTNDLDIRTLMILEDYLDHFPGIVIAVSHDRYFLDRVVRRIFAFEENGMLRQYEGGYTDYQAALEGRREKAAAGSSGLVPAAEKKLQKAQGERKKGPRKLKFTYQEQRDYETVETEIHLLEEEIEQKEAAIETAASDYSTLNQLMEEKEQLERKLDEKLEWWMYLEELAAKIVTGETER